MTVFSNGTSTITPVIVNGYESNSEHGNIVHHVLGSEQVDVVLRPASLRAGQMTIIIESDTAAASAEDALRTASVWALLPDTGEPATIAMQFVVTGKVTRTLDPETSAVWLVGFGWQEVTL